MLHFSLPILFLILVGIMFAPSFTLGCILIAIGHPILGVIAIIFSFLPKNN